MTMTNVAEIVREFRFGEPIYVTRPSMPSIEGYTNHLAGIWERKWLTNNGPLHQEFESRLKRYLEVEYLSVFCNATIALLVALEALRISSGEVITTPFSFPATAHVLYWNRVKPIFCDIQPDTFNLDPSKIERLISPETKAILPVHVYGRPCDVDAIQRIAETHGLYVIYDAAHAFGVKHRGKPLSAYGDISALSFHATKLFSAIEGGALVSHSDAHRKRINFLKNFGIADEETVIGPGINGKMNEFQAAFGMMQLDMIDDEIRRRSEITRIYRKELRQVSGITVLEDLPGTELNYAYFPILVDAEAFGIGRDELYLILKECNVMARKYFHPLISHASCYAALPSASPERLPVAERIAHQILCLPIYGSLEHVDVRRICELIVACQKSGALYGLGFVVR